MEIIDGRLDHETQRFDEAIEGFWIGEKSVGEFFEENDESQPQREVLFQKGGEGKVYEGRDWVLGGPSLEPCTAVLEIVNQTLPVLPCEWL